MRAEESITIQSPIDVVWRTLIDIDQWPHWQDAVSQASLQGPLAPQTEFVWVSGGMKIRSTLTVVSAPASIEWTGKALGTRAHHAWALQATDAGTVVTTAESMSGWLIALMGLFDRQFLSNALKRALADLKIEAERRHSPH